jgi:hypothetical protein
MEKGEGGHLVYPNLEDELASCAILVFVIHDVLWECGSNWWTTLWKDDDLQLFKGWWFYQAKHSVCWFFGRLKKN